MHQATVVSESERPVTLDQVLGDPWAIAIGPGNILYIHELSESGDSLLQAYDLTTGRYLRSVLAKGRGPQEAEFVDRLKVYDNQLHFVDNYTNSFVEVPVREAAGIGTPPAEAVRKTPLDNLLADDVIRINDEIIVKLLAPVDTLFNTTFVAMDSTGDRRPVGILPELSPETRSRYPLDKRIKVTAFAALAGRRPNGANYALAYRYTDRVEFYDTDHRLMHSVSGPDRFEPYFTTQQKDNGVSRQMIDDITRIGFLSVASNADHLYCLYSGKVVYPTQKPAGYDPGSGSRIFKFDWETGELVAMIATTQPLTQIAIGSEANVIYGISHENDTQLIKITY